MEIEKQKKKNQQKTNKEIDKFDLKRITSNQSKQAHY